MWRYLKRGFGYGVGGRLGWELGGLLWRWGRWAVLAVFMYGSAYCSEPVSSRTDLKKKNHNPAQQEQPHKAKPPPRGSKDGRE